MKRLDQKFLDKLRQYQRVKSKPVLSEKYFSELIESFVKAYKKIRSPKK
ncbi:hypothetical protein [Pedobacter rhodius]|uniref:Lacal_2735 family protein n=1 Tax=Pedobacter rhodius TaxID=3004098 RepID=A0ABT4L0X5_9SPHI|nr:hypothetical protein [Pedobacter sp. SJ11]MCZ4224839.1 hypothetical protein [Pedobacter sp. SJ11]